MIHQQDSSLDAGGFGSARLARSSLPAMPAAFLVLRSANDAVRLQTMGWAESRQKKAAIDWRFVAIAQYTPG